jgi:hypothetical protein
VAASATEAGAAGSASTSATFNVTVSAVAEAPTFAGGTVFSGSEEGAITLSGIAVSGDSDDGLTSAPATISGIPSGWTLYDGATALTATGGVATVAETDIGALKITAPDGGGENATLTLTVTSKEGAAGPATTGAETITVSATAVAEAPTFGTTKLWTGSEEGTITLSGLSATTDGDSTLTATLTGIAAGWTVKDGATTLTNGAAFAASDLGSLVVTAPDNGGEADTLTLTVSNPEGSGTSAVESITVSATAVAEAPTFAGGSVFGGSEEGTITLSGIAVSGDGDDSFTSAPATISGIPTGWKLYDGATALTATGGVVTVAETDIGALKITAPDGGGENATLTLTVTSKEGSSSTTGSETITVSATAVAEAATVSASGVTLGANSGATSISLTISDKLVSDGDDTLSGSVTITGVPSGWSLTGDGASSTTVGGTVTWFANVPGSLTGANGTTLGGALSGLTLVSPSSGDDATSFTLTVTAPSSEEGATTSATAALAVNVTGAAEAPILTVEDTKETSDNTAKQSVALTISETAADADDTLGVVTITGVPTLSGWSLADTVSAPTNLGVRQEAGKE